MTFLQLMEKLFDVKKSFPEMTQRVEEGPSWSGSWLEIRIPISQENAQLMKQAEQMFAPRDMSSYGYDDPPF